MLILLEQKAAHSISGGNIMRNLFLYVALFGVAVSFFVHRRSISNFDLLSKPAIFKKNMLRPFFISAKTWLKTIFTKKKFFKRKERTIKMFVGKTLITLSH